MAEQTERVTSVDLQRALIIGVGGTGGEVLVRTRRLLVNFFGSLDNVPIVRFLYLDTDIAWWNEQLTQVEKQVRLSEVEHIDLGVSDASELYRGIEQGNYPHYRWFSIEKLKSKTNITNGAGAIRQYGRLCFWYHYHKIRERILHVLNDLAKDDHAQFMKDKYGINVKAGLNVHIVAGLAGGTGSGIFLDLAYLVRKLLSAHGGEHQVNAYLVLPQAFRDLISDKALANGYAALKELNYYHYIHKPTGKLAPLYGEPVWDVQYTHQDSDRVFYKSQAPFDHCYLLDARNTYVDVHRTDIFGMIARALFHEFTLSFATFKRSLRANINKHLNENDGADCPMTFMSFGQSSALIPRDEIKILFAHQLALQGVQQWIDRNAKPIQVYTRQGETTDSKQLIGDTLRSIREEAEKQDVVNAVRNFLIRQLIPNIGLEKASVFAEIVREHQERLTDIPYSWREAVKQQWVAEQWEYDEFIGRVTDAWSRWRTDFNDEGADRMKWGEQIRKLEANKGRAFKTYTKKLEEKVYEMFKDTQQYGPAWALCVVQQLQSALQQLKEVFLQEANDPVTIATALGDVVLINAAAGGQGPSLSTIIEARINDELEKLSDATKSLWPIGKRERVERAAYNYLTYCAHWCRARVEERARRLAAELAEQLVSALQDLERELLDHATTLARLQGEMLAKARAWHEKALRTENIGTLLYNPTILRVLEDKIRQRQKDQYDPASVAERALKRLGKNLQQVRQDEVPRLLELLVEEALKAVGDLDEKTLADTQFAAHDLLSAQYSDDNQLQQALRDIYHKSAPYVRLVNQTEDGGWLQGSYLQRADVVGLRGGGEQDNDPDPEHARIINALRTIGIDVRNDVRDIEDSSQILFFQECGAFPIRALQGVLEMKKIYEQERKKGSVPLHIERDEMAERFPDLFPPEPKVLERALIIQTVGVPLGVLVLHNFPSPIGMGQAVQKYALTIPDPVLRKVRYIPLSETLDGIGIKLAYNPDLLEQAEKVIEEKIKSASHDERNQIYNALLNHLEEYAKRLKPEAEKQGVDPEDLPAYQDEAKRVRDFISHYRLAE
ncbi:MAG: hypothetical protein RUDDFDWM_001291 [Candidatus Fervidibacterota bacterium]